MSRDLVSSGNRSPAAYQGGGAPADLRSVADPAGGGKVAERDAIDQENLLAILGNEMSPQELRETVELVGAFMELEFGDMADELIHSRMPDGTLLGNVPEVVRALAGLAQLHLWLEQIDASKLSASLGGGGSGKSIADEMREIESIMESNFPLYQRTYRKRYLELQQLLSGGHDSDDD